MGVQCLTSLATARDLQHPIPERRHLAMRLNRLVSNQLLRRAEYKSGTATARKSKDRPYWVSNNLRPNVYSKRMTRFSYRNLRRRSRSARLRDDVHAGHAAEQAKWTVAIKSSGQYPAFDGALLVHSCSICLRLVILEQATACGETNSAPAVAQELIVPDPLETGREDMKQESAHKLCCSESHHARCLLTAIILPAERDVLFFHRNQTIV